jgi:hypothetical protein
VPPESDPAARARPAVDVGCDDGVVTTPYGSWDKDPGWRGVSNAVLWVLSPKVRARLVERPTDGLVMLRQIFVGSCLALVVIGAIVPLIVGGVDTAERDRSRLPIFIIVFAVGNGALIFSNIFTRSRRLDCSSDAALAASYRSRFFTRMAFAETPALCGFVSSFVVGEFWPYFLGVVFTIIGFARVAPTVAVLHRDEQELLADGCERSLVRALRQGAPTDERSGEGGI